MLQPNEADEIMAELRRNREALRARFGNNVDLILEDRRHIVKEFKEKARVVQEGGSRTNREAKA